MEEATRLEGLTIFAGPLALGLGEFDLERKEISRVREDEGEGLVRCTTCGVEFKGSEPHRDHVRSEWHSYNMRQLALINQGGKGNIVHSLSEFEDLKTNMSVSIEVDGSQTSETIPIEGPEHSQLSIIGDPFDERKIGLRIDNSNKALSVHTASIRSASRGDTVTPIKFYKALKELKRHRAWAVLLISGGRFSGVVYEVSGKRVDCKCTHHKSLARYTTRRKQGGSQGAKDNTGRGHIRSAGANIRRHNEKKLQEEVLEVLISWAKQLEICDRIFIFAPSRNRSLVTQKGSPLQKGDPRIRPIPLSLSRPTTEEAKRVFRALSSVRLFDVQQTDDSKSTAKETLNSTSNVNTSTEKLKEEKSPKEEKLKEEERIISEEEKTLLKLLDEKSDTTDWKARFDIACKNAHLDEEAEWDVGVLARVVDKAILKSKTKIAQNLSDLPFASTDLDLPFDYWHYRTCLHRAAALGNAPIVKSLLKAGCDPTVQGTRGQRPYNLALNAATRKEFREFAQKFPDACDWKLAGVPIQNANPNPNPNPTPKEGKKRGGGEEDKVVTKKPKEHPALAATANANLHDQKEKSTSPSRSRKRRGSKGRKKKGRNKYVAQKKTEPKLEELVEPEDVEWACSTCTYRNLPGATLCHVCNAPAPKRSARIAVSAPSARWKCGTCTFMNLVAGTGASCEMCGAARPMPAPGTSKGARRRRRRKAAREGSSKPQNTTPAEKKEERKDSNVKNKMKEERKDSNVKNKMQNKLEQKSSLESKEGGGGRILGGGGGANMRRSRLLDTVPRAAAAAKREEAKRKVKEMHSKYVAQLTKGCGNSNCNSDHCGSNPRIGKISKAKGVVLALKLIKKYKDKAICPNIQR
ncbi:hypothetical protein AAMO2058_000357700 [Amorphochlora amoebiformis]